MRGFHVWDALRAHFLASRKVSLDYLWAHFGLMSYTRLQIPNLSHFSLKLNFKKMETTIVYWGCTSVIVI